MQNPPTQTTVALAKAFFPILLAQASAKTSLEYGQLVEKAKEQNPDDEFVAKTIARNAARPLGLIRQFSNENNLPDLAALAVNKSSGEVGESYTDDAKAQRVKVFAYDWHGVSELFNRFVEDCSKHAVPSRSRSSASAPKPKKITATEAAEIVYRYFRENRSTVTEAVKAKKEEIVTLVVKGMSVEEAYSKAAEESN